MATVQSEHFLLFIEVYKCCILIITLLETEKWQYERNTKIYDSNFSRRNTNDSILHQVYSKNLMYGDSAMPTQSRVFDFWVLSASNRETSDS